MREAVHVAFEEGTQAQWLHDLVTPLAHRVVVCDRRGASRPGNKGDQVDGDQLSELLRRGRLRTVYHGSTHRTTLKELTAPHGDARGRIDAHIQLSGRYLQRTAVNGKRFKSPRRLTASSGHHGP